MLDDSRGAGFKVEEFRVLSLHSSTCMCVVTNPSMPPPYFTATDCDVTIRLRRSTEDNVPVEFPVSIGYAERMIDCGRWRVVTPLERAIEAAGI